MASTQRYWAVIPAAGIGTRMCMETPKQYLTLHGRTILEFTLARFCEHPSVSGIVVVLAPEDPYWETLAVSRHEKITTAVGGVERYHSVQNGLAALKGMAGRDDWVMVHDAARPCLRREDIDHLIETLEDHSVGGILAIPVRDTMKRAGDDNAIRETVDRESLWHALTPQMFRLQLLEKCLDRAVAESHPVTDESQAVEQAGYHPLLVPGNPDNIKITHRNDLPLAELFLSQQEMSST